VSDTKSGTAAAVSSPKRSNVVNFAAARSARATSLPAWTSLPPYVIYDAGPRYLPGSGVVLVLQRKTRPGR